MGGSTSASAEPEHVSSSSCSSDLYAAGTEPLPSSSTAHIITKTSRRRNTKPRTSQRASATFKWTKRKRAKVSRVELALGPRASVEEILCELNEPNLTLEALREYLSGGSASTSAATCRTCSCTTSSSSSSSSSCSCVPPPPLPPSQAVTTSLLETPTVESLLQHRQPSDLPVYRLLRSLLVATTSAPEAHGQPHSCSNPTICTTPSCRAHLQNVLLRTLRPMFEGPAAAWMLPPHMRRRPEDSLKSPVAAEIALICGLHPICNPLECPFPHSE